MKVKLLEARLQIGIFLNDNSRFDEALAMVEEQVVIAEKLVHGAQKKPHDVRYAKYLGHLGNAKCGLGMVRRNLGRGGWEEAIRSGLIHIQKAVEIDRQNPDYLNELGSWRIYIAKQFADEGAKDKASMEEGLALKAYQKAATVDPNNKVAEQAMRELAERGVR
jgi:tetratricopeptide (TPR) repeat protein